jgi:hypothetical protein
MGILLYNSKLDVLKVPFNLTSKSKSQLQSM